MLYRELQRAAAKLEMEKFNRKRIDVELQEERGKHTRDEVDLLREIQQKTQEVRHLKHEKEIMREWLERGVEECKKVAQDMQRIKQEHADEQLKNNRLEEEKTHLRGIIAKLTEQIDSYQLSLESESDAKAHLLQREAASTARMEEAENEKLRTEGVLDEVRTEATILKDHLRGMDSLERALRSTALSMLHVTAKLQESERALNDGDYDTGDDEHYISPAELENRLAEVYRNIFTVPKVTKNITPDAEARALQVEELIREVVSCSDGLSLVANGYTASIKNYIAQRIKWKSELNASHGNELKKQKKDYAELEAETELYKVRIEELQEMLVAERKKVDELQEALEPRTELLRSLEEVSEENTRLKNAARRVKLDWGKIEESRHRFVKLQEEVEELQVAYKRLEQENALLKDTVQSRQRFAPALSATSPPLHSGSVSRRYNKHFFKQRDTFEVWRQSIAASRTES